MSESVPVLPSPPRALMNGKPVFYVPAKSVLNLKSRFKEKLLCDGATISMGDLCCYECSFCYVPLLTLKLERVTEIGRPAHEIVVRRAEALRILRSQLTHANGKPKFSDPSDKRVVFASPLVDVAGNVELARETIEMCRLVLTLTSWHIRLLSKSNLLPLIAKELAAYRDRIIFGVSTGTLDDGLARAFEQGAPLVSKRLASLHWLQDNGFRTFGMICPSLPQAADADYASFAAKCATAIRADRCEHVWAEVINVRGESMVRTFDALVAGGRAAEAELLRTVSTDAGEWERYNRATFLAHASVYDGTPGKLRFLTYTTKSSTEWWQAQAGRGAVLLGANAAPSKP